MCYISLTISLTYSKIYIIAYHLTSNLLNMNRLFKRFENLTPICPTRDPFREGVNSFKNVSKYFLTSSIF